MKDLKIKIILFCTLGLISNSWAGNEVVTTYYGSPKGDYLSMKTRDLDLVLTDNINYHVDSSVCSQDTEGRIYIDSNNDVKVCPKEGDLQFNQVKWVYDNSQRYIVASPSSAKIGIGDATEPKYLLDMGSSDGKKLAIQSVGSNFIGLGIGATDKLTFYNGLATGNAKAPAELSSNGDFYVLGNMTASDFTMSKGGRSFKFDATAASNVDTWIRFKNTTNPSAVTLGDMAVGQFWQEGNSFVAVNTGNVAIGKTTAATEKLEVNGSVKVVGVIKISATANIGDKIDVGVNPNTNQKEKNRGQMVLPVYTNGQQPSCASQVGCIWVQES